MQETKEAEVQDVNVVKASPSELSAGYEGRKIGWTRILRHLFPHKVRRLLVEHDALEEMRSELQRLQVKQSALEEIHSGLQRLQVKQDALEEIRSGFQRLRAQGEVITEAARVQSDFMERALLLQGRLATQAIADARPLHILADAEFRVFSQWGEDGIIEWLTAQVAVPNHRFIEFGVGNFAESNCRFLMQNRNWKGLIFDGNDDYITDLRNDRMFWMYDLTAKAAFITTENINDLILEAGFGGPLGILSIDIDGNDYWVWKAINVVEPAIVICEYNPILGDQYAVTVPYDPQFHRFKGHHSGLYFGASIAALKILAEQKGYTFVGTNSNGINAFFVRRDLVGPVLSELQDVRAFCSRHRDSRDEAAELSFVGGRARFDLIRNCPIVDVETGATRPLGEMGEPYSSAWNREID